MLQRDDLSSASRDVALRRSLSLGWVHEIDTAPPAYYARRFKTLLAGSVGPVRVDRHQDACSLEYVRALGLQDEVFLCETRPMMSFPAQAQNPAHSNGQCPCGPGEMVP